MSDAAPFHETQRVAPWLMAQVFAIMALSYGIVLASAPQAQWPWLLPALAVPAALVSLFLATARMRTELGAEGIVIRMIFVAERRIPFVDIATVAPVTYRPIREYGGWGIRRRGARRAYAMRGNRGVQLTLASGGPVLIGSQRPEALASAIESRLSPPRP